MLLYSIIAHIIQVLFLISPALFIILFDDFPYWGKLIILLYIPYIYIYIRTKREVDAYKTWIYNIVCGNYDFLHSNRFRYWNSRAAQDADLVNLCHLSAYRFIPLHCMLNVPILSVMVGLCVIMVDEYGADANHGTVEKTEQVQTSVKDAEDDAADVVRLFYEQYITSIDRYDYDEVNTLKKKYLTKQLYDRIEKLNSDLALDCDPFLMAQDWDKSLIDKLKVEKDNANDTYRVYLWDNWKNSYKIIKVRVIHEGSTYKLCDLPDLEINK